MTMLYILIILFLIVGVILWMRLERRNNTQEEVADKVEPDLNSMFADGVEANVQSGNADQQKEAVDQSTFSGLGEIQHEDLAYYPKEEKVTEERSIKNDNEPPKKLNSADLLKRPSKTAEPTIATSPMTEPRTTDSSIKEPTLTADNALDEETIEDILLDDNEQEEKGFWQKIGGFFRNKRPEIEVFSDDGNLMRPASVDTVALILSAAPEQPFTFKEVLSVAHELDLRVENGGFIQLLTTTHYGDEPMYSIAHLLGDGTFDENLVRHHLDDTTPGLIFFSKIPGPDPDISTIEQLLAGIHHFHSTLGGTILDAQQRPMSNDDLIALFHKINKIDSEEWERAYEAYEARKS
ncbi:cell division protein ZipA C-terminal FtsZ-binding domain-containing protein [Ignatzschineria larvae DSM 13226]|uniref:Cell division protein ZipA n=1 Tax=Ignatzschineria larvae DSM 13226 TaxID=1111732 RepID=A0ABZ3C1I7_9GAMM|nr:cell division protein ZipA C-terminal FtsZ-binding domain-containing protein [Ignatzschineria larvae]